MNWTAERTERLRVLVADRHSASQISTMMGVTRNSIIGKTHRMGLSCGSRPTSRVSARQINGRAAVINRARRLAIAGPTLRMVTLHPEPPAPPKVKKVSLLTLKKGQCRFPLGDPRSAEFAFCGCKRWGELPYCEYHARLCYQAGTASRDRARRAGP